MRGFLKEKKSPSGKTEISKQNSYDYLIKFGNSVDENTLKAKKRFSDPAYGFSHVGGQR